MLSKKCSYGLRAIIYMACLGDKGFVSIQQIAKKLDISFHFLTKIFQTLTDNNITTSYRGPKGGIVLARSADSISLLDVVLAIDGDKLFTTCTLGLPECSEDSQCPMHRQSKEIKDRFREMLEKTSLKALSEDVAKLNLNLYLN